MEKHFEAMKLMNAESARDAGQIEPYFICPISAASSTGRCNTVESVDPTALPDGELLCPAVPDKTLARMALRLNQRSRTPFGCSKPVSSP